MKIIKNYLFKFIAVIAIISMSVYTVGFSVHLVVKRMKLDDHSFYFKLDKPYRGWQGVVFDGNYYYVTSDRDENFKFDDIIEVYSKNGDLIKTVKGAYTKRDDTDHFMSFGSPSIIGNKLYVTVYNCDSGGKPFVSRVAVYSLDNLSLKLVSDYSLGANIAENVVYHDGYFWACYFDEMIVEKFDTDFELIDSYSLPREMKKYGGYQGLVWQGDSVYLNWHGPNNFTKNYEGGLDKYDFDGYTFTYEKTYSTPTFGCGQSVSKFNNNWIWNDRVMNRVVITDNIYQEENECEK